MKMEALPKQPQGVAIDVVDEGGGEEQQRNQKGNEEQDDSRCSLSSTEIIKEREPCSMSGTSSSSSSPEVDLESGVVEPKPYLVKETERDCRICHLTLDPTNHESGVPIELGCSCKDDLAAAHKHCAEAWFKIKGNRTCEICGSTAWNVVAAVTDTDTTEPWNEANDSTVAVAATVPATIHAAGTRNFWQGHRFLNFLLACMVFAFVISWLFHFNVPS
ncbi:hypothetical protein F3Y22_tig00110020pilonHSYRG00548 [Hibiscus syriacus]|uniref:RING-CH-type domain-containing protein n=1 Tax=Hibiscus syriacus TaxID=106335 RepID=A0A6A3BM62_HIBSY|nr:uncharacterized protein LOC120213350 [Hibiscus syriacus]KAE8718080.1 hypothetical protein F3Y22_tig00110020pilonHSYRG00548 [Hibiscus syriacus]